MLLLPLLLACTPGAIDEVSPSGDPCALEVDPASLSFGAVEIGEIGARVVQVTNPCQATQVVDAWLDGSPHFTLPDDSVTLGPGTTHPLEVAYLPTDEGAHEAELVLEHHGAEPTRVQLRGRGGVDADLVDIEPYAVFVSGRFGVDGATGMATSFFLEGSEVPITVEVLVANEAYFQTGDGSDTCTTLVTTTRPQLLVELDVATAGLELPVDAEVYSNCRLIPEDVWGDPAEVLRPLYSIGVGHADDELRSTLGDWLGDEWVEEAGPYLLGGFAAWDFLDAEFAVDFAFAMEADADMVLVDERGLPFDGTADAQRLPAVDALGGEPLAHGVYELGNLYGLLADRLRP